MFEATKGVGVKEVRGQRSGEIEWQEVNFAADGGRARAVTSLVNSIFKTGSEQCPLIHFATRAAGPLRASEYQRRSPVRNWTINDSAASNGALTINLITCFASSQLRIGGLTYAKLLSLFASRRD